MRTDLVALGIRLGWIGVDDKEEPAVAAVMEFTNLLYRYVQSAEGARRQTLDPKPTDVNRLISGMDELIRRTVGPGTAGRPGGDTGAGRAPLGVAARG